MPGNRKVFEGGCYSSSASMRRSSRLQKAPEDDKQQVEKLEPQPKINKASKSRKDDSGNERYGRKRGSLEKLAKEAPLDVALEVFTHLEPLDIINLSRTNKLLRTILMSRSSRTIWRAALANVPGLPPLPLNLSELRYAHFVFDTTCQGCYRGSCDYIAWECYVRCHKSCAQKLFFSLEELSQLKNWNENVMIMMQRGVSRGYIPHLRDRKILGKETPGYLPSTVKRFRLEYMEVKDDPNKLQKWEHAKTKEYEDLQKFAFQGLQWHKKWVVSTALNRQWEDLAPRRRRRDEIIRRLAALGWSAEDLMHRDFGDHPLVNRSKELTDRDWDAIKPTLIELLHEIQTQRLDQVYASRHKDLQIVYAFHCKMQTKSPNHVYPPIGDFILSSNIKAVNDLIWNTPNHQEITHAQFIRCLLHDINLEEIAVQWKTRILEELRCKSDGHQGAIEGAIFRCTKCQEVLWVPRVYAHRCLLEPQSEPSAREPKWERSTHFNPFEDFGWTTWSSSLLGYSEQGSKYCAMVKDICGEEDLKGVDKRDPVLRCVECDIFFRWTRVLAHPFTGHTFSLVMDEEILSAVYHQENSNSSLVYSKMVICRYCKATPSGDPVMETIQGHLKARHGVDEKEVKRRVHWSWKVDTPFNYLHPCPVELQEVSDRNACSLPISS